MAAVQHEPVAEEVVQFLPGPSSSPVPPPSQLREQLTYPSSWPLHCRHGAFFSSSSYSFLFNPFSGFFLACLYKHFLYIYFFPQSISPTVPFWLCRPPLPSLSLSCFASPPPSRSAPLLGARVLELFRLLLLLPQRAGLKRRAWEFSRSSFSPSSSSPHPPTRLPPPLVCLFTR